MVYKRLTWRVIVLQILVTITLLSFLYALNKHMIMTCVNLGLLAIVLIAVIIHNLNKTNRDLAKFFEAFHYHDGTLTFRHSENKSFKVLHQKMEKILDTFRKLRTSLENDRLFYLNALNHTGVGIIILDMSGRITFSNRAAQIMLGSNVIRSLQILDSLKIGLTAEVMQMKPGDRILSRVVLSNQVTHLSLRCNFFRVSDELFRIFSLQDIKHEIEQNESEAWQKLIRILTHEIMNSVSPITINSAAIIHILENTEADDQLKGDLKEELLSGLRAIRKRSKGLAAFIENYQSINQLPQPVFSIVQVNELFSHIEIIMKEELQRNEVSLEMEVIPESLAVHADEKLLSQILINLLQNSIFALENFPDKKINLQANQVNDQVRISLTDNGKGIPADLLDSVFVPFFTTRKNGSGIGLSLAREIMKLHDGGIRVNSKEGSGTTITLIF